MMNLLWVNRDEMGIVKLRIQNLCNNHRVEVNLSWIDYGAAACLFSMHKGTSPPQNLVVSLYKHTEMLHQMQHPQVISFQNDMGDLIISFHKPTSGHSHVENPNTCLVFQTLAFLVHLFKMQWLGSSLIFL